MKSIKARYEKQKIKTSFLGDYINLSKAIRSQKFSRRTIEIFFNNTIDSSDYSRTNKKELIDQLYVLSNTPEEGIKQH